MKLKKICNYPIEENTYIVYDDKQRHCVIIDPFDASAVDEFLDSEKLTPDYVFLTHEHIDHINGLNGLKMRYDIKVICSEECSRRICDPRENLSMYFQILLTVNSRIKIPEEYISSQKIYSADAPADIVFTKDVEMDWNGSAIRCISTPGHTSASICIVFETEMIFTGDSLLRDEETVTRLPSGSKKDYMEKTIPFLRTLDNNILVLPGHGEEFILKEKCDFLTGE